MRVLGYKQKRYKGTRYYKGTTNRNGIRVLGNGIRVLAYKQKQYKGTRLQTETV